MLVQREEETKVSVAMQQQEDWMRAKDTSVLAQQPGIGMG